MLRRFSAFNLELTQRVQLSHRIKSLAIWSGDVILSVWVFFGHWAFTPILLAIKLPSLYFQLRMLMVQSGDEFLSEFSDCLSSMAALSATGKSMPHALETAIEEFSGQNRLLKKELKALKNWSLLGMSLTSGLDRIAGRYQLQEITDLSDQIRHALEYGNDITAVLCRTSEWIGGQIHYKQKKVREMTEKIMEFRILSKMPLVILVILNTIYPEYLENLYITAGGRLLMCLAALAFELSAILFEKSRLQMLKAHFVNG
jgi:Flp pilus assembly protein TadB